MLQAKTKGQQDEVIKLLQEDGRIGVIDHDQDGIYLDDWISFTAMEKIVDYLRSANRSKKSQLDMSIVAPNMLEPVETWLAYKKEKGQMYKPTAFKTFYRKFCELCGNNPQVAMAIVEQSIQNNYAGIFPLRNNNNNNYGRVKTNTEKFYESIAEANEFSRKLRERIDKPTELREGDSDEVW